MIVASILACVIVALGAVCTGISTDRDEYVMSVAILALGLGFYLVAGAVLR